MFKKYCRALYRSIYDPTQYREAIMEWTGFGGIYLFILSIVISAIVVGFLSYTTNEFRKTELPYLMEQMPVVTIKKGNVSIDKPGPVTIKGKDTGFVMIIDPKSSENELEKKDFTIAVGKNYLLLKSNNEMKLVPIDQDQNIVIDKPRIESFITYLLRIMPFVIFPIAVVSQTINYLFQAFLIALGSFILTAIIRQSFTFDTRMRLSALALTPAILVNTISLVVFQHPILMWFNFLLGLLFIYTMILLLRRQVPTPAESA